MNLNEMLQVISYLLIAIGGLAFLVSVITQVIKSWPGLDKLPTSAVVIVLSLLLCPSVFASIMSWQQKQIKLYMMFACIVVSFVVALVAMSGWDRLKEIWDRTGYKKGNKEFL